MSEKETSLFKRLQAVDVSKYVEKKQGLTYLSWAHAWRIFKEHCPDATYSIGEYHGTPELGYMCNTSVTAEGVKHCMWLPVMDGANKSMKDAPYTYETRNGKKSVAAASMFDVNKTAMRCLVKNLAMFGLGLYIYAGEDLPVVEPEPTEPATWDAWSIPFETSKRKGQTLGEIVMEGAVEDLRAIRKYLTELAKKKQGTESYDYWCQAKDFATVALQEAEKAATATTAGESK